MIPDWQTNHIYFAEELTRRHPELWQRLRWALTLHAVSYDLVPGTPDIWLRDFFPIQVACDKFVQFRYEPDYLQGCPEKKQDAARIASSLVGRGACQTSEINLDGGNVVASERVAILTEKVFRENPSRSPRGLESELRDCLQLERCIFIPEEPGDPLGHADGMVRWIDKGRVLVNNYSAAHRGFGRRLRLVLRRHHLDLEEIPYFTEGKVNDGIPSAVGCYVNYLRSAQVILAPVFGSPADDRALDKLASLFPRTPIVPIQSRDLAREGGVLHCVSWTVRTKRTSAPL